MNIQYYTKNVYGNELEYIKDDNIRHKVFLISGEKTLTFSAKEGLKGLGFTFQKVLENN